jgi:hypothetical protein
LAGVELLDRSGGAGPIAVRRVLSAATRAMRR